MESFQLSTDPNNEQHRVTKTVSLKTHKKLILCHAVKFHNSYLAIVRKETSQSHTFFVARAHQRMRLPINRTLSVVVDELLFQFLQLDDFFGVMVVDTHRF